MTGVLALVALLASVPGAPVCAELPLLVEAARAGRFAAAGARERLSACIQSGARDSHPGLLGITAAALGQPEEARQLLQLAGGKLPPRARLALEARQLALCAPGTCSVPTRSHAEVTASPLPVATRYLAALHTARPADARSLARLLLPSLLQQADTKNGLYERSEMAAMASSLATVLHQEAGPQRDLESLAWRAFPMEESVAWLVRPLQDAAMRKRWGDEALVQHIESLGEARQNFEVLRKAKALCGGTLATPAAPCPALPRALGCRVGLVAGRALRGGRQAVDALGVLATVALACRAQREAARFVLGRAAMGIKGRGPQAVAAFEAVATDHPEGSLADDALVLAGESLQRQGNAEGARALWKRAAALKGDLVPEAMRLLAMDAMDAGRVPEARGYLQDLASRFEATDPEATADAAYWRALLADDTATASTALQSLVNAQPWSLEAELARGLLLRWGQPVPAASPMPAVVWPRAVEHPGVLTGEALAAVGLDEDAAAYLSAALSSDDIAVQNRALWGLHGVGAHGPAVAFVRRHRSAALHGIPTADTVWLWHVAHPRPHSAAVESAAAEMGVAPALLWALVREESGFRERIHSTSGAVGLTQLLPATAMTEAMNLREELHDERDLEDPVMNLRLGASYLARMTRQTGSPLLAVAAYNAGPGVVVRTARTTPDARTDQFIRLFPIAETRTYLRRVLRSALVYRALYGSAAPSEWDRIAKPAPATDGGAAR